MLGNSREWDQLKPPPKQDRALKATVGANEESLQDSLLAVKARGMFGGIVNRRRNVPRKSPSISFMGNGRHGFFHGSSTDRPALANCAITS
jgi:hypothetical protein